MPGELKVTKPIAPRWAMILLLALWACFFCVVLISSPQGVPVFVVIGYMVISGLVNRREASVRPGYLRVGTGPLFGSGKAIRARTPEVVRWYVRYAVAPTRYGESRFWAAGAELANGERVDAFAPYETREQAFDMGRKPLRCSVAERRLRRSAASHTSAMWAGRCSCSDGEERSLRR